MRNFLLNQNSGIRFNLLSPIHIIITMITFLLYILIIYKKDYLYNFDKKIKLKIKILYGLILLISLIIRRGSFILYGVYDWRYNLDIGFCSLINILTIIYCFTNNQKILRFCCCGIFCGPLLLILLPSVTISINNYSFLNFILFHNITFLITTVFIFFEKVKIDNKILKKSYNTIFIVFILTYCFNTLFKTKYNELSSFINEKLLNNVVIGNVVNNKIIGPGILMLIGVIMLGLAKKIYKIIGGIYEEN